MTMSSRRTRQPADCHSMHVKISINNKTNVIMTLDTTSDCTPASACSTLQSQDLFQPSDPSGSTAASSSGSDKHIADNLQQIS